MDNELGSFFIAILDLGDIGFFTSRCCKGARASPPNPREAEIEPILNPTVASENSLLSLLLVAVDDSGWEAREDHHIQGKGLAFLIESMRGVH